MWLINILEKEHTSEVGVAVVNDGENIKTMNNGRSSESLCVLVQESIIVKEELAPDIESVGDNATDRRKTFIKDMVFTQLIIRKRG